MNPTRSIAALGTSLATVVLTSFACLPAHAADSDGDRMPDAWEIANGLRPHVNDARRDKDHDGLNNLGEYRRGADPQSADTDGDGYDDGDEVADKSTATDLLAKDTDDNGTRDGDEDLDVDGVANEDEDDASESCRWDDADTDGDRVTDEDENDFGLRVNLDDSDEDGLPDGAEDFDHDGEPNEDEDDAADDRCDTDNGTGEDEEDADDILGVIASYDAETRLLSANTNSSGELSWTLSADVVIVWNDNTGETEGPAGLDDLVPAMTLNEIDLDDEAGLVTELEISPASQSRR